MSAIVIWKKLFDDVDLQVRALKLRACVVVYVEAKLLSHVVV